MKPDALTVRPGEAVTYHTPAREPVTYNGEKLSLAAPALARTTTAPQLGDAARESSSDLTAEQKLIAALDAIRDLGHSELLLHEASRADLIHWAGHHGLAVVTSGDAWCRETRVMHVGGSRVLVLLTEVRGGPSL